jgi:hypothetical protein
MRVQRRHPSIRPFASLLVFAFIVSACSKDPASAQALSIPSDRAALIVFSQQPLSNHQWSSVSAAMQKEIADTPQLSAGADLLRGEDIPRGLHVPQPISVYLHGNCNLTSLPQSRPSGALGWVRSVYGQIEPFIHVDCSKIAQELGPLALGMDRVRRDVIMGEAIARVIAHEWIHISTQNAGHAKEGVTKSSFGAPDLLTEDGQIRNDPRFLKARWRLL